MISRLQIKAFRGVPGSLDLKFGQLTLLSGRNGLGKTTVFDAIDWCLFGFSCWRLTDREGSENSINNLYRKTADLTPASEPKVSVTLSLDAKLRTVERTRSTVTLDGVTISDGDLVRRLIRDASVFPPFTRDRELGRRVRSLVYLPQEDMRALIQTDRREDRSALLHTLLGVPHAQTWASSVRRVRDKLSLKEREHQDQRASLQSDIEDLSATLVPVGPEQAQQRRETLQRAKSLVKDTTLDSPSELLALCRAELNRLQDIRRKVETQRAFLREILAQRESGLREIETQKVAFSEKEAARKSQQEALQAASNRRNLSHTKSIQATEILGQLEQRIQDITAVQSRLESLAKAKQELANLESSLTMLERAVQQAEADLSATLQVLSSLNSSLQLAEDLRKKIIAREQVKLADKALRDRQNDLRVRLQSCRDQQSTDLGLSNDLSDRLSRAEAELRDSAKRYSEAAATASDRARLAELMAQASSVLERLKIKQCPLCGQVYKDTDDLANHIQLTLSSRAEDSNDLVTLRKRAEEATVRVSQLGSARQEVADRISEQRAREDQLLAEIDKNEKEEIQLTETLGSLASDLSQEDLTTQMEDLSAKIRAAEDTANKIREAGMVAQSQVANTNDSILLKRAQIAGLEQATTAAAEKSTDALLLELEQTRTRHNEATVLSAKAAAEYQAELAEEREIQISLDSLTDSLGALRASLAVNEQRLKSLTEQMAESNREMAEILDGSSEIDNRLLGLAKQESALNDTIKELESLVHVEQARTVEQQIKALQTEDSRIDRELKRISRARKRLNELDHVEQECQENEAEGSLRQLHEAIQECFTTLYPHRHLDRLRALKTDGEVLVCDSDLSEGVSPELYSSTGQLNALALAYFLGASLRQRVTKLQFVLMDEPVQNLADIYFLAFMALVKRIAASRQIVLSTADANIAELFKRQMISSSVVEGAPTCVQWNWVSFDPKKGPEVQFLDARQHALSEREDRQEAEQRLQPQ